MTQEQEWRVNSKVQINNMSTCEKVYQKATVRRTN